MSKLTASLAVTLIALCCVSASAFSATAEPLNVDADMLARLAKEKARRHSAYIPRGQSAADAVNGDGENSAACGNVDIGNFVSNGRGSRAPREINVIITGDVINANNNCR